MLRPSRTEEDAMSAQRMIVRSAVAGLLLAVSGCGSDDGGGALTKEEWIASADAICADMMAQEEEIPEPQSVEEMVAASEEFFEITRAGIGELKDLGAPEGDEGAVAEIVAAFEDLVAAGDAFIDAVVESGSLDEMSAEAEDAFRDLETAQQQAKETAESYGLTGCFQE
jgi:hypothetical protein